MTGTQPAAHSEYGTDQPTDAAHPLLGGTLEHLDPASAILEDNVRDDADLDKEFLDSIREHGVVTPIVGERGDDAVIRVRAGQRRTLAARAVGLATIPVYIRPATNCDATTQRVERIGQQMVENEHRKALTEAQRARGIQQMLDAGVSVTKVAKTLSVPRDIVKAAATAAGSSVAMNTLASGQLSLMEASALTEFEEDEAAVQQLIDVAGGPHFNHTLAVLRQKRATAKAYSEAAETYVAQGYRVLDARPAWRDTNCVALHHLRTADGEEATNAAITNPAHWAVRLEEDCTYVDRQTGEPVDDGDIDFDTQQWPEDETAEGLRHFSTVIEKPVFIPHWYCIDYQGAGLDLDEFLKNAKPIVHGRGNGADLDGDDADAHARREAEAAEAAKRERKRVIALNKLGDAATSVRRQFVRDKLLSRKTPPKGAAIFVADCLTRDPRLLEEHHGRDIAAELLGATDHDAVRKLVTDLAGNGDGRAQVITLALVLGALEARTPKDAWRDSGTGWLHFVKSADDLKFLVANGYRLAQVEEVMTGARSADDVYEQTLQHKKDQPDELWRWGRSTRAGPTPRNYSAFEKRHERRETSSTARTDSIPKCVAPAHRKGHLRDPRFIRTRFRPTHRAKYVWREIGPRAPF